MTLPICFGYDSSELSGRRQKDVLVMLNMCIVIIYFISFKQYLLFMQNSERGLFEAGYFPTNIYNALQLILVFLTDVPKPAQKENIKTPWIYKIYKTWTIWCYQC